MTSFVYQAALTTASSGQLLTAVRRLVRELKKRHPELAHFSLKDMSLRKRKAFTSVTLYFERSAES